MQITLALYLTYPGNHSPETISRIMRYIPGILVTVAGPCETCQLLLGCLGRWRDVLLRLEWQRRPELRHELELLQRAVARDLDTVGDLGLYRLRRSTLLSILSTILTYVIVMAQFQLTEFSASEVVAPSVGNATG
ncbi:hypothetical protein FJT64_002143 [Amphibalanus amphitrite]|uniref:Gustatory receptor n=1 Tax=Amphibalanus amphitrite TaxID=1232801 RepID=A0A6A4X114_AMPAM|nr:hypothetical protein FJT64_002143 [Amphibalanus amphitrite]